MNFMNEIRHNHNYLKLSNILTQIYLYLLYSYIMYCYMNKLALQLVFTYV